MVARRAVIRRVRRDPRAAAVAPVSCSAVTVLDSDTLQAALQHAIRTQAALAEITAGLTSLRDPDAVLQRTVEEAVRLLDAFGAALGIIDGEAGLIRWAYQAGMDPESAEALVRLDIPVGRGIVGRAFEQRRTVFTDDYPTDPQFQHLAGADTWIDRTGVRSMVAAPLPGEAGPLGILAVFSRRGSAFSDRDRSTFETLADQAAIALENARLIDHLARSREELRRRAETERSLAEIAARIAGAREPEQVLQAVVDEARHLVGSDSAHLTLLEPDGRTLSTAVVAADTEASAAAWLRSTTFPLDDDGLHARAAAERVVVWTDDSLRERAVPGGEPELPAGRGILRAVAVAPLATSDGGVAGTLAISYDDPRSIDPDALQLLGTLADLASVAIANARLEADVHARAADLAASEERARLARELHDPVTQALFSMTLLSRSIELLLDNDPSQVPDKLAALRELQRDALAELRSLVFELRPSGIAEQGLVHALRTHAAAIEGRIGLPVAFEASLDEGSVEIPIDVAEALYRIAQEGLHNVVRHARASRVELRLTGGAAGLGLSIVDDGVGFDPDAIESGHVGIESIRARAERLGGSVGIDSRPGRGTRIHVRVPLAGSVSA